ncbi:hypothetical protein LAV82_23560 [Bacillus sp. ILBB4]|nr:hypothetical protein [Bacillus sp. ILBB4]
MFISVYTRGGIISDVITSTEDLVDVVEEMNIKLKDNFDSEVDDARIFNTENQEVHSYDPEDTAEKGEL